MKRAGRRFDSPPSGTSARPFSSKVMVYVHLFSPSLISLMVSVDVKHHVYLLTFVFIVQELCESRGGRPGLSVLTSLLVSVDVKLY